MEGNTKKETEKQTSKEEKMFVLIGVVITIVIFYSLRDEEKFSILIKDFSSPVFLTLLFITVLIIIWGMVGNNIVLYNAVQTGAIALITAYMSTLNMTISVFYIVAIFAYFTGSSPV